MKRRFITSIFLVGFVVTGFSQTVNINDPVFKAKVQGFTNEVFQNCPVFTDSIHLKENIEIVSRIEVITENYQPTESYKPLSGILLKNKCNPSLTRDELNFNPASFNPLKYFLNWYPNTLTKYRVDNSNYVIVVHPKP